MATITPRIARNGSTTFQVKIRLKGAAPISKTFSRKTDAAKWAKVMEANILQDQHFPYATAQKRTVNEVLDAYLCYLAMANPRRLSEVRQHLDFWRQETGHFILAHFRADHVHSAQKKLFKKNGRSRDTGGNFRPISNSTVNRYTDSLRTAMRYAITPLGWTKENPVSAIKKLKEPDGRTRFLSPVEIDALLDACRESSNPYLFAIVMWGIATGARKNEIKKLRWSQITPDNKVAILGKTKNGKTRSCQLTGPIVPLLAEMRLVRSESDFIFPSPNDPRRPVDFDTAWDNARSRAKVSDFRFHDLRHTCGSYLAMGGAGEVVIAEILGHVRLDTVRRYTHLAPTHVAKVIGKMTEGVLGHVKV